MKTYIGIKMANLDNIYSTSVKFYSSLTRRQAKGLDPIGKQDGKDIFIDSYPGAICFVSDASGNSIFLNKLLFGDGASSGTVEVSLANLPVVIDADGNVLKTLADYFNSDGAVISDVFKVQTTNVTGDIVDLVVIDNTGITIGGYKAATTQDILNNNAQILQNIETSANNTLDLAKQYANGLITSVYKYRGSVPNFAALQAISNPQNGDVYDVQMAYNGYSAGTNWAYVVVNDTSDINYPGYWDALGGKISVDLTDYPTKADMQAAISSLQTTLEGEIAGAKQDIINTNINPIQNSLSLVQSDVTTLKQTTTSLVVSVDQNTTNITNIATQLTWQ